MTSLTDHEFVHLIHTTLEDTKAFDIKTIDVSQLTDVTDTLVICTAGSTPHARALAEKLLRAARDKHIKPLGVEGQQESEWVLVDFGDIIVHIMLKESRDFYNLEALWSMNLDHRHTQE